MFKLIVGLLLGAILVYMFEPRHGREHREMLADRLNRGKDLAADRDGMIQAGRDAVMEAKDRAQTVASHAQERFGNTVNRLRDDTGDTAAEARDEARELNDSVRDRARVAMDGNQA